MSHPRPVFVVSVSNRCSTTRTFLGVCHTVKCVHPFFDNNPCALLRCAQNQNMVLMTHKPMCTHLQLVPKTHQPICTNTNGVQHQGHYNFSLRQSLHQCKIFPLCPIRKFLVLLHDKGI